MCRNDLDVRNNRTILERIAKWIQQDVLTDKTYKSIRHSTCSGHAADGTKKWLEGFYLAGGAVDATTITNEQFVTILDPTR